MPSSKRTPKNTVKVRRLPQVGEEIMIKAIVTRTGRNRFDTADTITVRIGDHPAPVTATAKYLLGDAADD
jgi:hypothetical protein